MKEFRCTRCKKTAMRRTACVNRARRIGAPLFCSLECSHAARRTGKTMTKEQKREYDMVYRAKNRALLKAKKAAYHKRTYTYAKAKAKRNQRKRAGYDHAKYCRAYYADPKRKAHKVEYDADRRSRLLHGDYWAECHRMYVELCKEIRRRQPNWYERAKSRGFEFNKAKNRRRACGITAN